MIELSRDPAIAERQMNALVFYLTAFGYIDGEFDKREQTLVKMMIRELVTAQVELTMPGASAESRAATITEFTGYFVDQVAKIDLHIRGLFSEAREKDEDGAEYVASQLKLRCYEIFMGFAPEARTTLLSAVDELMFADGRLDPAEAGFRKQLEAALAAVVPDALELHLAEEALSVVEPPVTLVAAGRDAGWMERVEVHYDRDKQRIAAQFAEDLARVARVTEDLAARRRHGNLRLAEVKRVTDLRGQEPLLDRFVYAVPPRRDASYDITVIGDLHGCYSNLKAALAQSRFYDKLEAWRRAPSQHPEPKVVLLGDYIDRGIFSFDGVLRGVLELYLSAPEHVYLLRGNHEYFVEFRGRIYGGVKPSEGINSLVPLLGDEPFVAMLEFFETLPSCIVFEQLFFVHGGIPRDSSLRASYRDLGTLNDADLRFQMLWSDPVPSDYVPEELQDASARFRFGRHQFEAFMAKIDCTTMIRGHEKIDAGFHNVYPSSPMTLLDVFSAGGARNQDVPEESSYRNVVPMAATVLLRDGRTVVTPWRIDYEPFMHPARNRFYAVPRRIEHVAS